MAEALKQGKCSCPAWLPSGSGLTGALPSHSLSFRNIRQRTATKNQVPVMNQTSQAPHPLSIGGVFQDILGTLGRVVERLRRGDDAGE